MKFSELKDEVYIQLHDDSEEIVKRVGKAINQARNEIAFDNELPKLRILTTVSTVVDQAYLTLPEGNAQRLLFIGDSSGPIPICVGGLPDLLTTYPLLDQVGDVVCVALEGDVLYYQKIPVEATSLVAYYTVFPTPMVSDNDEPEELPAPIHRDLITNKALEILYRSIEDSAENEEGNVNTRRFEIAYKQAENRLRMWLCKRKVHMTTGVWDY